eukprot:33295_1
MATTMAILSLVYIVSFDSIHSICTISSIALPNQHILQSAYISAQNTAYTFGSYEYSNRNVYKYKMSSSLGFIQISTTPTEPFYSYANGVAIIEHLVYFIGVDRSYGAVHIFDTETDSWINNKSIASPPTSAVDACIADNQTHIFSVGGGFDAFQIYDITKNTWTLSTINISGITGKRYWGQMCWMTNNILYVFGGSIGDGWDTATANIYKWQQNNGWSSIGTLPQMITTVRAEKHPLSNNIFIIGGFPQISDTIYQFNVDTEAITNTYHLVNAIDDFAADFVGHTLYVWGSRFFPTQIQICTGLGLSINATTMFPIMHTTIIPNTSWHTSTAAMDSTDNRQQSSYKNGQVKELQRAITIIVIIAAVIVAFSAVIIAYLRRKSNRKETYEPVVEKRENEAIVNMLEKDAMNKSLELSMLCGKEATLHIEQNEYELEDGTREIRLQLSVEPKEEHEEEEKDHFIPGKKSMSILQTPRGVGGEGQENKFCSLCGGVIVGNVMKNNGLLYCALCWENEDRSLSNENEKLYATTNPEVEGDVLMATGDDGDFNTLKGFTTNGDGGDYNTPRGDGDYNTPRDDDDDPDPERFTTKGSDDHEQSEKDPRNPILLKEDEEEDSDDDLYDNPDEDLIAKDDCDDVNSTNN